MTNIAHGTPLTAAMNYVWDASLSQAHKEWLCRIAEQSAELSASQWLDIPLGNRYPLMVTWTRLRRFVNENEGAFENVVALRHGDSQ